MAIWYLHHMNKVAYIPQAARMAATTLIDTTNMVGSDSGGDGGISGVVDGGGSAELGAGHSTGAGVPS